MPDPRHPSPSESIEQAPRGVEAQPPPRLTGLRTSVAPQVAAGFTKDSTHLAMDDVRDSVAELRYYREHFLQPRMA